MQLPKTTRTSYIHGLRKANERQTERGIIHMPVAVVKKRIACAQAAKVLSHNQSPSATALCSCTGVTVDRS